MRITRLYFVGGPLDGMKRVLSSNNPEASAINYFLPSINQGMTDIRYRVVHTGVTGDDFYRVLECKDDT